eukprot:SAG31_NODE_384_length_16414_cov_7.492308_2_plen_223_part_00
MVRAEHQNVGMSMKLRRPVCLGLLLLLPAAAAAGSTAECTAPFTAAAAAAMTQRRVHQLCSDTNVGEALRAIRVDEEAAEKTRQTLARLGVHTALDLRLLAGGPEADELLRQSDMSLGDKSKLRLLLGDQGHLARLSIEDPQLEMPEKFSLTNLPRLRGLQEDGSADGMSADTVVIVLSVLVGAAGYVLQAWTARRAERAGAQQAREQELSETRRQRERKCT